jgi:hypothetical protein
MLKQELLDPIKYLKIILISIISGIGAGLGSGFLILLCASYVLYKTFQNT